MCVPSIIFAYGEVSFAIHAQVASMLQRTFGTVPGPLFVN